MLLVAGACLLGWIAAFAEYCQYGGSFGRGECATYELANVATGAIISSVGTIFQALVVVGVLTISILADSLRIFHRTLTRHVNP
jgi:hypothetical protein